MKYPVRMERNTGYSVYSVFGIFMCVLELLHTWNAWDVISDCKHYIYFNL